MSKRPMKQDLNDFMKRAKESKIPEEKSSGKLYGNFQVRVTRDDYNRLRGEILSKDLSIQSVLIEALNLWLNNRALAPISDPGTGR